jgi:hypothetical protein
LSSYSHLKVMEQSHLSSSINTFGGATEKACCLLAVSECVVLQVGSRCDPFEEGRRVLENIGSYLRIQVLYGFKIDALTAESEIARTNKEVCLRRIKHRANLGMEDASLDEDWLDFVVPTDSLSAVFAKCSPNAFDVGQDGRLAAATPHPGIENDRLEERQAQRVSGKHGAIPRARGNQI